MDALYKENLMLLLGFGPPFPVHPQNSQDFLKNIHLSVLTTLQEMKHTYSACCIKMQMCVARNKTSGTYKYIFFRGS